MAVFRHARRCVGDVSNARYGQTWRVRPTVKVCFRIINIPPLSFGHLYFVGRCIGGIIITLKVDIYSHHITSGTFHPGSVYTYCIVIIILSANLARVNIATRTKFYGWKVEAILNCKNWGILFLK